MTEREITPRPHDLVVDVLAREAEPEVERILVDGAVVEREGEHYRIVAGAETTDELGRAASRLGGRCDCGAPLSDDERGRRCRTCGREYRA